MVDDGLLEIITKNEKSEYKIIIIKNIICGNGIFARKIDKIIDSKNLKTTKYGQF